MNTQSPCSARVLPDPRRKQAVVEIDAPHSANATLHVDAPCEIARDANTFTAAFKDARYWSPEEPHAYRATLNIREQSLEFPIALRQFTVAENRFRINQRPIPIRGAAIRSNKALTANTLKQCSALGYNAVRVPIERLDAHSLDFADETGMLVFATLANDTVEAVRPFFNHPSIVAWHFRLRMNSTGSDTIQQGIHRYATSVREIDPTRLILCDTFDADGFPLLSAAANPNQTTPIPVQLARIAVSPPMPAVTLQVARRFGSSGCIVSAEIVCPLRAENKAIHPEAVDEAIDDSVRALRLNERVAAYWVEADHEKAGPTPAAIAGSVHQPVRPIAEMGQRSLLPRRQTSVRITLTNDTATAGRAELSLQVVGPTGQVLWKKKRGLPIPKTQKEIWRGEVGASGKPGLHRFIVRLMKDRRVLAQDDVPLHVLPELEPLDVPVHIADRPDFRVPLLTNVTDEPNVPVYIIPPLANTIWAYPPETVCSILAYVQDGAAAVVLSPPQDWNELAACFESLPRVQTVHPNFACNALEYHTARHPILEGVRTADVMGGGYQHMRRDVMLAGETEDTVSQALIGPFDAGSTTSGTSEGEFNDIIVRTFGEGKLIFANYDPLTHADRDAAAANLLRNLVEYAYRRAVPGTKRPPFQQAIDEWRTRAVSLMQWRILAPLRADALPPPPSRPEDFEAEHTGAYGPVTWAAWWMTYNGQAEIGVADACLPGVFRAFGGHGLTGYAAHMFRSATREPKTVQLDSKSPARLWINGRLSGSTADSNGVLTIEATMREGLNTIAVETEADESSWRFTFKFR